ncbi:hypothetical protein J2861_003122 [Agrobacterium tumefaciens]|jgi:hypothetical protein|nr:hypothetical protein [Agrobacterium tumefaciens]MDP9789110.1 hypothetical protein [Agrobacterium tumefaciens]MDP9855409.1 hypothetical protein [Agrobacterium tumefaciens]
MGIVRSDVSQGAWHNESVNKTPHAIAVDGQRPLELKIGRLSDQRQAMTLEA